MLHSRPQLIPFCATSRCTKLKGVVIGLVHKCVQLLMYCFALDMLIN